MCGICGILDTPRGLFPIFDMNRVQRHRGPDDEGYLFIHTKTRQCHAAGGPDTPSDLGLSPDRAIPSDRFDLALGTRRLAILDLSSAGHMPMLYRDGTYAITYNGEVYNYIELRRELQGLGHTFTSNTDTEVILAGYAEWGADCLCHFNGMFAFALWDGKNRRLFCARDRFGIKPFYYFWNGSTFVFASEIKAVLQHPAVPRVPNDETIFHYLALGLSDHSEQTFFENILSLPAGHFLTIDTSDRCLAKRRWWETSPNPSVDTPSKRHRESTCARFADLLEDAVRLRLRSDVAVGSCLSGGLDSSSIVCLANRLLLEEHIVPTHLIGYHQKTFTARYQETEIDEYAFSHQVIQETGAEEHLIFPSGETLWAELESFVWHMDEPVNSTSTYAQWNVMRLARQCGVTVLLDGQGGDEVLAGYYSYYPPYLSQIRHQKGLLAAIQAGWDICRVGGAPVVDTLLLDISHRLPWRLQSLLKAVRPPRSAPGSGLQDWQLSEDLLRQFWDQRWRAPSYADGSGLAGILYQDLTSTNLPKLLRYEDRNSAAFSRETRLPFLDYRLVEMLFSLPLGYRIQKGWSKWIMRSALNGILPKEVCWRRSKLGFPTPESKWFSQGVDCIRRLLTEDRAEQIASYVRPDALRWVREQSDDRLAATPGLWRLINLVVWFDVFFSRSQVGLFANLSQAERQLVPVNVP